MTVQEAFIGTFECAPCGYETVVQVRATGGRIWAPNTSLEAGARPSTESASEVASVIASRTLMFVRCPRCGARDPKAGQYRVQVLLGAVLAACAGAVLAFLALMKSRMDRVLGNGTIGAASLVGVLAAWTVWRTYRRAWTDVDARVTFRAAEMDAARPPRIS